MAIALSSSAFTVLRSRACHSSSALKPVFYFTIRPRFSSTDKRNVKMCASVDGVGSFGSTSLIDETISSSSDMNRVFPLRYNICLSFSSPMLFLFSILTDLIGHAFKIFLIDTISLLQKSYLENDDVPMPKVHIDQDTDLDATIVYLSFGDRLGALIDTMKALRDLGLGVSKGTVTTENNVTETKFFITRRATGRKVEDPDLLERIRLTIINNLLKYHPESSEQLAMGEAFGIKPPVKKIDVDVATHIHVKEDGPKRSLLYIETADRPGLLLEMIKIFSDSNVTVESAEIDTEGLVAKDKFHVSYRGSALNSSMSQGLVNSMRYYLRRPETDEDSY